MVPDLPDQECPGGSLVQGRNGRTGKIPGALVDRWYKEETDELEKSRSANENYERDKTRLAELYAQKRLDALSEEQAKNRELMNKARDLSFDAVTAKLTLYGSKQEQEVMKMQSDMEKAVASIDDKYAKLRCSLTWKKRWLPLMTSTPSCPRTLFL